MTALSVRPTLAPAPSRAGWAPLAVVLGGTFVCFLDFFIVNVALPSIATDLSASPAAMSLVVAGYGLTFAAGMITGGRLGDLYGRRRMFALGLALFTLASLACGLAPNAGVLIGMRLVQGAAASLLTPQVLAILNSTYEGQVRQRAFAAYGFAMGVAGVLGQLLGGVLISADIFGLGWRAIFLINLPVGLVVLVATKAVPESRGPRARLDLAGVAAITLALTALVLPLAEGREHGWPVWTLVSFVLAPLLLATFVVIQRRAASPLVELSLFGSRSFSAGTVTAAVFACLPAAFFFVLALYLQDGKHYSALFSGVVFMAVGVGYFAAMLAANGLAARLGRGVLALGAAFALAGFLLLAAVATTSSSWALLPGLALVGWGIGLVLVPVSAIVLAGVDPRHIGSAAGVLATSQQVGGAVGVAAVSSVFFALAPSTTTGFVVSLFVLGGIAVVTALSSRLLDR